MRHQTAVGSQPKLTQCPQRPPPAQHTPSHLAEMTILLSSASGAVEMRISQIASKRTSGWGWGWRRSVVPLTSAALLGFLNPNNCPCLCPSVRGKEKAYFQGDQGSSREWGGGWEVGSKSALNCASLIRPLPPSCNYDIGTCNRTGYP